MVKAKKKVAQARRKGDSRPARLSDLQPEEWEDLAEVEYVRYLPKNDRWKEKYKEPVGVETAELPELTEGWAWVRLEQIVEAATGATPKRGKGKYWDNGSIPWITSGVVNELFVDQANEFITEVAIRETNTKVFPKGTFLVAMYGEGKTRGKVTEMRIEAATNQALAALIFQGNAEVCKQYIKVFLQKNYEDIRRLSSGGVQPNLNLSIVRRTHIPLPPLAEQERIVAEVEQRLSVVAANEKAIAADLARAERLRQSVLQQAFSGQLVATRPQRSRKTSEV